MSPAPPAAAAARRWLDRLADPWQGDGAAALSAVVPPALLARLLAEPRVRPRLAERVFGPVKRAALPTRAEFDRPDPFALDAASLAGLAALAGAIWHAGSILRVIERGPRARLREELGEAAFAAASRHRALAPPGLPTVSPEVLPAAVAEAGAACLAAWAEALDPGLAARLRCRLPAAAAAAPARPAAAAGAAVRAALAEAGALG